MSQQAPQSQPRGRPSGPHAFLDELIESGAMSDPAGSADVRPGRPQIARVRYTHEDCVDLILANPGISQNEIAARYGYSAAWISVVINSDAFQARLAARRVELIDPGLMATLNERFRALTVRSVEVLQEKLCLPSSQVPDQLALQAAALGAKALGLGLPQPQQAAPQSNLHELAERLRGFVRREASGEIIDVPSREIPPPAPAI